MLKELLSPEIKELIKEKQFAAIREGVRDWEAPEVADLLMSMDDEEQFMFFRTMDRLQASDVFSYLDSDAQKLLLNHLTSDKIRFLLSDLSPDDRTALLEELPAEITRKLFELLPPDEMRKARELLGYPEDSIGRLMTPDYVAITSAMTVQQALHYIRENGRDKETIYRIYVVDGQFHLVDDIPLRKLIFAEPEQPIEDIMDRHYVALSAYSDRKEAVTVMERYDLMALPVLDSQGVLVGIVTHDDVFEVALQTATEEIHKSASINPLEISYKRTSILSLYRKRILWLTVLLIAYFISSEIISIYQHILAQVLALAFFMPMLIGSGGNTGSQSATLIVRALALNDVAIQDWLKIFLKEITVGLLLGLTLAGILFVRSYTWQGLTIALTVSCSLTCIIIWSNLVGAMLPLVLTRLRLDPALVSSPLVATLIDSSGILIYFTIAQMLLHLTIGQL